MATDHICCLCNENLAAQPSIELLASRHYPHDHIATDEKHFLCADCFGQQHAKRGCEPCFKCPHRNKDKHCCKGVVIGHRVHKFRSRGDRNIRFGRKTPGRAEYIAQPHEQWDPVRFYAVKCHDEPIPPPIVPNAKRSDVQISLAFADQGRNHRAFSVNVPTDLKPEEYPEKTKETLIYIMRMLFNVYSQGDTNEEVQKLDIISAKDLPFAALQDDSFLFKAVVALATGSTKAEIIKVGSNQAQVRTYTGLWVATEMIRRSRQKNPGILQKLIAKLLSSCQVPDQVKDTLSMLKISASRETQRLDDIKQVNYKLLRGWDLTGKRYWVVFVTYDNLGFRILGAKAGYDQYVFIQVHFISAEQLQELGFYQPRTSEKPPISRVRKTWEELKDELTPDSILPTKNDYAILGEQILSQIEYFLPILHRFPTLEESEKIVNDHPEHFESDTKLSVSHGISQRIKCSEDRTASLEVQQAEEEPVQLASGNSDELRSKPTMFDLRGQDIRPDVPLHADLNKTETVKGLVNGALDMRQKFLDQPLTEEDEKMETDEPPLMEDFGIPIGGDGAPCNTFIGLERQEPEKYAGVSSHAGGFHMLLNCLQKCGARFGETHLREFLDPFRSSDKKKDWFLNPGDPGQTLQEQPEMVAAHYIVAARKVAELKAGEKISATDVHDHMLARAKDDDHCMVVLMWLHMTAVADVLRDSERENDPELFRSGAKLALVLYAKCGAPKYMRMGFYYWLKWQMASDAERILHDKFFFTKKTVGGKYVFFDRFQEWFNKEVRVYLGKHKRQNQYKLCVHAALLMGDRKKVQAGSLYGDPGTNDDTAVDLSKEINITTILCHQIVLVERLNLWGLGPVCVGKKGKESEPDKFVDPSGEFALNPELLFDITSGERFLKERFAATYLDTDGKPTEEIEKKFPPKQTTVLSQDLEKEKKEEILRCTSDKALKLQPLKTATKRFLANRLRMLFVDYGTELGNLPEGVKSLAFDSKRDDLLDGLARVHGVLKSVDSWEDDERSRIEEKYRSASGYADKKRKEEELKHDFYSFPDYVREEFAKRKYWVSCDEYQVEEGANDGDDSVGSPNDDWNEQDCENFNSADRTPDPKRRPDYNMGRTPELDIWDDDGSV